MVGGWLLKESNKDAEVTKFVCGFLLGTI